MTAPERLDDDINVFVHLSHGVDVDAWKTGWSSGTLIGINEPSPYGYDRAREMGCRVTYSTPRDETPLNRIVRLSTRAVLGFDLVHAWRNRTAIRSADVVWTHTETQGLAVAALLFLRKRPVRPALILQNVWLIDRWPKYPPPHRWLFTKLLRTADALTFHSERNRAKAAELLSPARCDLVMFGIRSEEKVAPRAREKHSPLSVLTIGNDEHRDWETAVRGIELLENAHLTVLSRTFPKSLARSIRVTVGGVRHNSELEDLFAGADVVLIALKPNEHASGLTVLQESVLHGVPVVVSDAGGLTSYFDDQMVTYVPPGDPRAIADAITRVTHDPISARIRAVAAQSRMSAEAISSAAFVRKHVELSRELLGRPGIR